MSEYYNKEAEEAYIGTLLAYPDDIATGITLVPSKDHFYFLQYGRVYDVIRKFFDTGRPVTIPAVAEYYNGKDHAITLSALHGLTNLATSPAFFPEYARLIKDNFTRRRASEISMTLTRILPEMHTSEDVITFFETAYSEICEGREDSRFYSAGRAAKESVDAIFQLSRDGVAGLPTGFDSVDKFLTGLKPDELVIIASRPSVGKSAFAMNVAEHIAHKSDRKVLFFSLEMSARQIMFRMFAHACNIRQYLLRTGEIVKDKVNYQRLQEYADSMRTRDNFSIFDGASVGLSDVRAESLKMKQSKGLDLIVIDYLQLMKTAKAERRELEIANLTRGLKILAKELHIPVILLSQLNRFVEQSKRRPALHDLRESGAIEQDADVVMFLHRPESVIEYKPTDDKQIECIVAKNRDGACGTVEMSFRDSTCTFMEK